MSFGAQLNTCVGSEAALAILGDLSTSVSAAGTNQSTATLLTTANSIVTTVAFGTGVRLPVTGSCDRLHVANHGANTLAVYPPSGGKLSNSSVNVPALMAPNKCADFFCIDGTNYTALLGH